jgi:hypothetical protein
MSLTDMYDVLEKVQVNFAESMNACMNACLISSETLLNQNTHYAAINIPCSRYYYYTMTGLGHNGAFTGVHLESAQFEIKNKPQPSY